MSFRNLYQNLTFKTKREQKSCHTHTSNIHDVGALSKTTFIYIYTGKQTLNCSTGRYTVEITQTTDRCTLAHTVANLQTFPYRSSVLQHRSRLVIWYIMSSRKHALPIPPPTHLHTQHTHTHCWHSLPSSRVCEHRYVHAWELWSNPELKHLCS